MSEQKKITAGEPIYSKESKEYQDRLSYLIGRHNVLCGIEKAFNNNPEALKNFNEAVEEVLDSGNQSMSSMFALAIEKMADKLQDYDEEINPDIEAMRTKIRQLETENNSLRAKLDSIAMLVERQKRMG